MDQNEVKKVLEWFLSNHKHHPCHLHLCITGWARPVRNIHVGIASEKNNRVLMETQAFMMCGENTIHI